MALSIGFGNSVSLLPAIQATRSLTFTSVSLSLTEHTSFSWICDSDHCLSRSFLDTLPYSGFSPVRLEGRYIRRGLPVRLRVLRVVRFASALRALRCLQPILVLSRGAAVRRCTTVQAASATLPQGSSFRSGLCCPGPSSLIDPMRPTRRRISISRTPLIRDALAVRPNCDA
jgi:hypothetical protein